MTSVTRSCHGFAPLQEEDLFIQSFNDTNLIKVIHLITHTHTDGRRNASSMCLCYWEEADRKYRLHTKVPFIYESTVEIRKYRCDTQVGQHLPKRPENSRWCLQISSEGRLQFLRQPSGLAIP